MSEQALEVDTPVGAAVAKQTPLLAYVTK